MDRFDFGTSVHGFKLNKKEYIDDIYSTCYVFEHEKSGARLVFADNSDDNKVFFIAFKTPPVDSCGTAHILEHSVLCGSEKYTAKDPFNELAKGSLNTYLNALTYSDKTMYPVASRNEKDFENLMSVYVDAVFAPVVLREKKIFMQEGWHYELDSREDELKYKGVVYNEMKGAYSSPDRVLYAHINRSLFGDTVYGYESGGDPESIVELTYDNFKDFYNKYYHPSNSYIYIYGDTDVEKHMEFLDREYLSKYERAEVCSDIKEVTAPFSRYECGKYSVSAGEKKENDSIFAINYVTGKSTDLLQSISMDILTYILFDTNASPVKKALIESGICEEAEGWHDNTTYQCVLSIIGKNCKTEDKDKFINVVKESLEKASEGLDKKLVLSVLNFWEFMLREADFGYKPKGLAYGMSMMKGYLHGQDAAECLKTWKFFDVMRDGIDKGYFENLIKENILSNDFSSFVMIEAEEGLQAENDKKDAEKLQNIKENLTDEEIDKIIEETKALKEYQSIPDSEEIISRIPLLSADEIDREKEYDKAEEKDGKLYLKADTNGIVYAKAVFKADCLEKEELCYVGLLEDLVGRIDTENFDYSSLPSEINMYTGGIEAECIAYSPDEKRLVPAIAVNGKALERNLEKLFELMGEVVTGMKYDCKDSMLKIIKETKGYLERKFEDSGHSVASIRALACCKNGSAFMDMTSGIAFYDFILWAEENIDEVCRNMARIAEKIFIKENLIFAFCCEEKYADEVSSMADKFKDKLVSAQYEEKNYNLIAEIKRQGITNSSKVVYNSIAANFKKFGFEYSGKMKVIKNIVNTEYLWNEVRVRGGAYGCGCNILRNGSIYTYSYRDPDVKGTYDAYRNIGEFLRNAELSPREMTKYILGAINEIDKPKGFQTRFDVSVSEHLNNITKEKKQKEREELISTKAEDVASFGEIFDKAFEAQIKVTLGNEKAIRTSAELFDDIRGLKKR